MDRIQSSGQQHSAERGANTADEDYLPRWSNECVYCLRKTKLDPQTSDTPESLAVPLGTVSWAAFDTEKGYCGINLIDITGEQYHAYTELLKAAGFAVVEEVSEEIKGENDASVGIILSKENRALSISSIPGQLVMYISYIEESDA